MSQLLKIAKKKKEEKTGTGVTPHDAMLELFDRTGALSSRNSDRGAKFLVQLYKNAGYNLQKGAHQMLMQGKDIKVYIAPEDRVKIKTKKRLMKGFDKDRLKAIARQNKTYSNLIGRLF